ncbi:hypothetical protein [Pseudomonas wadenswilerensis]|uniref:Uncharacterized protein n=1 Tax=Pseudomonas wadenswilerensis TaxID=1785161 RepID=A0A380SZD4_9PSED|nr:hypothetical protein [Pseudomonas wadenswilerensis]SUQ62670.1 hypothetical protein CCOS864_02116 [Pseudomonas wadenswilerensis]
MIGGPTPNERQQVLDQLSASIDQFFAGGGQPVELPAFEYRPRRPHHGSHNAEGDSTARAAATQKRQLVERAREAAKTMTLDEAYRSLGVSRTELHRLAKEAGIFFQSCDKERQRREVARQAKAEEKAKLVELIKANSGIGLSRNFVAKKLGISNHYLVRLAEENGIDFPRWSDRP